MPSWSRARSSKPVVPTECKQPRADNIKEKLPFTITIQGVRSLAWTTRVCECSCLRQSFLTSVLSVFMQTAGLAGAQAELCAVRHGERRQQGHVHQERGGQRAQQTPVGDNFCWKTPVSTMLPLLNSAPGFQEKHYRKMFWKMLLLVFHRVVSAIEKVATDLDSSAIQPDQRQKTVSKVKQKARAFLQEMVANVSPAFIRYIELK